MLSISIDHIHAVMHHFKAEPGTRKSITPSRKLWTALDALDGYLIGQSNWLVRCAVYNGTLGSDFGQKFWPANDPNPPMAIAA
jgi:hypothetical protein